MDYDSVGRDDTHIVTAVLRLQRAWREYARCAHPLTYEAEAAEAPATSTTKEPSDEEQREELLERYRALLHDREGARESTLVHQRALVKLFADRRGVAESAVPATAQEAAADAELKYWEQLRRCHEDRDEIDTSTDQVEARMRHARERNKSTAAEAVEAEAALVAYVKERAAIAKFGCHRKPVSETRLLEFAPALTSTQGPLHDARISFLKLRARLRRLHQELQARERQKDGMHLIDFEQLKIENTNFNEKIEERNEELLKLRKKATTTTHVLTHVKEKLEFVKGENAQLQRRLQQVEEHLAELRDRLTQSKRERDSFVTDNLRMREKMPLIGAEDLLLDYEVRKKEIEQCRVEVVELTNRHHALSEWLRSHQGSLDRMKKEVD